MTKALRLDDEAVDELDDAAVWYEDRRTGLGSDFLSEVRDTFAKVARSPRTWPLVRDVPPQLPVRKCLLRRFPYSVVYIELEEEIRVIAIAHGSREPGFWRHRL